MSEDASGGIVCIIPLLSALISLRLYFSLLLYLVPVTQPDTQHMQFTRLSYAWTDFSKDRLLFLCNFLMPAFALILLMLRVRCVCARAHVPPQTLVNLMTFSAWQQSENVQQTFKKWSVYSMQLKLTNSNVLTKVAWNYWSFGLTVETLNLNKYNFKKSAPVFPLYCLLACIYNCLPL